MLLLLDTHAFLWWLADDARLGVKARAAIADPDSMVHVSAATTWEIAVKRAAGKLDAPGDIIDWIDHCGFTDIPIEVAHTIEAADLPLHHRDPFDRLLVAQARLEKLTLVARDPAFASYDVTVLDAGI